VGKIMTKIDLKRFRDALKKKQGDLEDSGNSGREALAIEISADELDRIQHAQERDFVIGGLDRNAKLLRQVRAALGRIDAGTFGICLDCDEEISMKRLAAMPWSGSCISCQEAADNMAGQPGNMHEELLMSAD
jgi:DnaK suppressor protein